jgi:glycerophosphoryl diester phosphodiesterase
MTLVVGHRGAPTQAPENTMESFRLGVEAGADAIELDVHLSADGQLAVIHDDTLGRTTDRTGAVADRTMDEIREADAGAEFPGPHGDFPFRGRGLTVPTLPEVLDWLPAEIRLVVEIKARAAADAVVSAVRDHAVSSSDRLAVISFDEHAIERVRELDREIKTGYLLVPTQPIEPALVWATEHGHTGVLPWDGDLGLDPLPLMARAQAYGREIGCYVVNDPERMQHLAACRLWAFVTDVPDVAREALGTP